jgi:hypothetical protein
MIRTAMKKLGVLLGGLILLQVLPLAEENLYKKYDAQFSLSGGTIKGKFSLAGEFVYAREFGGVFTQISAMTNNRDGMSEHGFSLGLGAQGSNHQFYVFFDNLYRLNRLWSQVRAMYRLNFGWLNLGGSYSLPIKNTQILIDDYGVTMAKVWEADFNLIPTSWAKIIGTFYSAEGKYQKIQAGIEIRPLKMVSVKADWNKTDSHFYSNWSVFEDFRISLNLLLGTEQLDFRQMPSQKAGPFIVRPAYPMLVMGQPKATLNPNTPYQYYSVVEVLYSPEVSDIVGNPNMMPTLSYELFDPEGKMYDGDEEVFGSIRRGFIGLEKIGERTYRGYIYHVCVQQFSGNPKHVAYVNWRGLDPNNTKTCKGLTIQFAKDLEIQGYQLFFNMAKF